MFFVNFPIFGCRKGRSSLPERQSSGYKRRNSWNQADPVPSGVLHRNAENAQSHGRGGNGWDLPRPVPSQAGEYYHRCSALSALLPDLHEDL